MDLSLLSSSPDRHSHFPPQQAPETTRQTALDRAYKKRDISKRGRKEKHADGEWVGWGTRGEREGEEERERERERERRVGGGGQKSFYTGSLEFVSYFAQEISLECFRHTLDDTLLAVT